VPGPEILEVLEHDDDPAAARGRLWIPVERV
jgi:hypothetical protein